MVDEVLETILESDDDDIEEVNDQFYLPAVGMSIPVPRRFGNKVRDYYEKGKKAIEAEHAKWDKSFELYQKCGDEGITLPDGTLYPYHFESEADENIVRQNIRRIMRSTYMRNPHLEYTDVTTGEFAESLQYVTEFIMNKKTHPGLNLKSKARRWILHGQLTNFGILRLDFQPHEGSRQEAVEALHDLEKQLEKAKTREAIDEIYAKLEIIHEELPLSLDKGLRLTNVLPHKVIVDPDVSHFDLHNAKWLAEEFEEDRELIRQKFYFKDEEGDWRMRSQPERATKLVTDEDRESVKDTVLDIVMNERSEEQREIRDKNKVRCVYFYDKILRRIHLFSTEDWTYPLWSWDDDMGLSRFFRHFILSFGEPVDSIVQPGEVSFYIGQVNEVNRINRKAKQVRDTIFNTLVYNKKAVDVEEVKKLVDHLRNPRQVRAFGIGNDTDQDINHLLSALAPPAYQFKDMFDSNQLRTQINQAANVSDVEGGGQFRTNTTNEAIEAYSQIRQELTQVNIDIIEEAIEDLGWAISEMLVSKYTQEEIIELVGNVKAQGFEPMSVPEFNRQFRMHIAAGSIEKPTSQFKKQEAIQIAQAIGQFGQAAPGTSLKLLLRMFEEAFTNFVVKKEDWAELGQEVQANLTKGVSTDATPE